MDCKEFREELDQYVDGELPADTLLAGRSHLKGCIACGRFERQRLLLRSSVKRVVNEPLPPPELLDKVRAIATPAWRRWFTSLSKGAKAIWHQKVAIPMPAFALFFIAIATFGIWVVSKRTAPIPSPAPLGLKTVTPARAPGGLDLTQFDRGERAVIQKVRLRNP
jgi:anti-sigma factor RsiW